MFSRVWKLLLPVALACSLYYASEVDFARERSLDGKPLAVSINQTPGTYIVLMDRSASLEDYSANVTKILRGVAKHASAKQHSVAVLTFANSSSEALSPTSALESIEWERLVDESYSSAIETSTNTNIIPPLLAAERMIHALSIHKRRFDIILISDGDFNDGEEADEVISRLKSRAGVQIKSIGIGRHVDTQQLNHLASSGKFSPFVTLDSIFAFLDDSNDIAHFGATEPPITMEPRIEISARDGPYVRFRVDFLLPRGQYIPRSTIIQIDKTEFFEAYQDVIPTAIDSNNNLKVELVLRIRDDLKSQIDAIKAFAKTTIAFSLFTPSGKLIPLKIGGQLTSAIRVPIDNVDTFFAPALRNWPSDSDRLVSLLIIGPPGSGKSALVNSIVSAPCHSYQDVASVGAGYGHVTKNIKSIDMRVPGNGTHCQLPLIITDSTGIDETWATYNFSFHLAQGNVKNNLAIDEFTTDELGPKVDPAQRISKPTHLIFTLHEGILADESALSLYREQFQIARRYISTTPIIAVTMTSPENFSQDTRSAISKVFQVPESSIFIARAGTHKTFENDISSLLILFSTLPAKTDDSIRNLLRHSQFMYPMPNSKWYNQVFSIFYNAGRNAWLNPTKALIIHLGSAIISIVASLVCDWVVRFCATDRHVKAKTKAKTKTEEEEVVETKQAVESTKLKTDEDPADEEMEVKHEENKKEAKNNTKTATQPTGQPTAIIGAGLSKHSNVSVAEETLPNFPAQ